MTNISDLTPSYADSASFRKARFSWMMFDWACSPISALHTTFVFAVYFTTVVMPEGGSFAWSQNRNCPHSPALSPLSRGVVLLVHKM